MSFIRTQTARQLAGAPAFGKWVVYTQAWWETDDATPTPTVIGLIDRFFTGRPAAGSTPVHFRTDPWISSAGSGLLTAWEWNGSTMDKLDDYPYNPVNFGPIGGVAYPSQCAIAIGYRRPLGEGENPQRGRSRFWVGPLYLTGMNASSGIGLHLTSATVDDIANNAAACVTALEAEGWVLQVRSGIGEATSFAAANEVYVDDRIDVMRSRAAPTTYQARVELF
jgi:hypothetical protein